MFSVPNLFQSLLLNYWAISSCPSSHCCPSCHELTLIEFLSVIDRNCWIDSFIFVSTWAGFLFNFYEAFFPSWFFVLLIYLVLMFWSTWFWSTWHCFDAAMSCWSTWFLMFQLVHLNLITGLCFCSKHVTLLYLKCWLVFIAILYPDRRQVVYTVETLVFYKCF